MRSWRGRGRRIWRMSLKAIHYHSIKGTKVGVDCEGLGCRHSKLWKKPVGSLAGWTSRCVWSSTKPRLLPLLTTSRSRLWWRFTADHIVQTEITQISDVECRTSSERGCEPTSKFKTHLIDVNLMFVVNNVNCKVVQSLDQSTLCRCIVLVLSDTLNMSESMKWVMRHRDYERHRGYERHD